MDKLQSIFVPYGTYGQGLRCHYLIVPFHTIVQVVKARYHNSVAFRQESKANHLLRFLPPQFKPLSPQCCCNINTSQHRLIRHTIRKLQSRVCNWQP